MNGASVEPIAALYADEPCVVVAATHIPGDRDQALVMHIDEGQSRLEWVPLSAVTPLDLRASDGKDAASILDWLITHPAEVYRFSGTRR